jgi:serine/threonine-protein kinase
MPDDAKPATTWLPPEVYEDQTFCSKYLIERELGVGGSGVVVGARHHELDERVAIKFLLPGRPQSRDAVERFRREARAANRIKNQHVVRIFDVSQTSTGIPYIVMEYLDGIDLERMLLQSPQRQLPIRDAVEFMLQACEVLAECHGNGIVHRDLKPSNLFCVHGADGLPVIKVLDFGISKLGSVTAEQSTTGEHTIMGSPRYMSPEQFDSSTDVDQRADIWALGVILYELVTGSAPFADDNLLKIWRKVEHEVPLPLERLRRDAPAALTPIVMKCLEKDPRRRYPNVAELAKAILPFGPERSRGSVTRIVRIVEAPGVTTGALDLRLFEESTASEVPTIESAQPDTRTLRETRWPRHLASVLALVALALVLGSLLGNSQSSLSAKGARLAPGIRLLQLASSSLASAAAPVPARAVRAPDRAVEGASATGTAPRKAPPATSPPSRARSPVPPAPVVENAMPTPRTPDPVASATLLVDPPPAALVPTTRPAQPLPASSETSTGTSPSPWLVDIVEQRRPKRLAK